MSFRTPTYNLTCILAPTVSNMILNPFFLSAHEVDNSHILHKPIVWRSC